MCLYVQLVKRRRLLKNQGALEVAFVRPLKFCECDISKMSEPILLQIGVNDLQGKRIKCSTFGVRRSKVKVTGRISYIWRHGGGVVLDPLVESIF